MGICIIAPCSDEGPWALVILLSGVDSKVSSGFNRSLSLRCCPWSSAVRNCLVRLFDMRRLELCLGLSR